MRQIDIATVRVFVYLVLYSSDYLCGCYDSLKNKPPYKLFPPLDSEYTWSICEVPPMPATRKLHSVSSSAKSQFPNCFKNMRIKGRLYAVGIRTVKLGRNKQDQTKTLQIR